MALVNDPSGAVLFGMNVQQSDPNITHTPPFSANNQWALCPAALLPELQLAPCFLSAIIGQID